MRAACVAVLCALLPGLALASVGKVVALEGQAWRSADGVRSALAVGSAVEAHDELSVAEASKLKVVLDDGSELALGPGSILDLDQAVFHGSERSFLGNLRVGRMLSWVKKKLSGPKQKFEVGTDRAVAGVRGTIFSVEVTPEVINAFPPKNKSTRVKVTRGRVAVRAGAAAKKKERHQVAGPQQISKKEWERRFVLLKQNQMVEIGDGGWKQSSFDPDAPDDLKTFLHATP